MMEQGKGAEGAERKPFTVVAGKIEGDGERNYKYIDSFSDVMDAVQALDKVRGYPFAEIEYRPAPAALTEHDAESLHMIAGWMDRDGIPDAAKLLRRLAASPADQGGWQPIETAPCDGSTFLGYKKGEIVMCHVTARDDGEVWKVGNWSVHVANWPSFRPSHWMPLPTAPGSTSPATGGADDLLERLKNPLTPYGMLVRALRIVADTSLYEMAKSQGRSPAYLSAVEHGREPATDDVVADTARFFAQCGIDGVLWAMTIAQRASKEGV